MNQDVAYTQDKGVSALEVLNSLDDIIYVSDQNGELTNLYGLEFVRSRLKSNSYLNRLLSEIFNGDENSIHAISHKRCLQGERLSYEWDIIFISKTYCFKTSLTPILNGDLTISAIMGVVQNVSKEKALDKHYHEVELMFKTLTNAAKSAIISVNEDGAIEYCNPATLKLFEYEYKELHGQKIPMLLYSEESGFNVEEKGKFKVAQNFVAVKNVELNGITRSGKKIPIELSISPYNVSNIRHHVIIIQDINERKLVEAQRISYQNDLEKKNKEIHDALEKTKRMQNQLVQSEKMASLGALISGIGHEINNPLAFVSSNLNRFGEYFSDLFSLIEKWKALEQELKNTNQFIEELNQIDSFEDQIDFKFIQSDYEELMKHNLEGIDRIKKIVLQLRGFSHMSDANAIDADLNLAIDETLTLIWSELKYKATVIKKYGNIPMVSCQVSEIKQIFMNLLVNASQSIETKGDITIETLKEADNVVIKISDTGKGMNSEIKRKIFDPFFTTKAIGKGTGLGLWICMSIIQKHHGNIEVESEEGKGSTFKITLPISVELNEMTDLI